MVEPDGNAPSLAGCKPAVQSSTLRSHGNWRSVRALLPRPSARQAGALLTELTDLLNWWTRTVTLRLLLGATQPCALYTTSPWKNWTQGMELHQPRQAYETRQSTGSPCSFIKWCGVTVILRAVSMSSGVTVQVASLTIYRRVLDLE